MGRRHRKGETTRVRAAMRLMSLECTHANHRSNKTSTPSSKALRITGCANCAVRTATTPRRKHCCVTVVRIAMQAVASAFGISRRRRGWGRRCGLIQGPFIYPDCRMRSWRRSGSCKCGLGRYQEIDLQTPSVAGPRATWADRRSPMRAIRRDMELIQGGELHLRRAALCQSGRRHSISAGHRGTRPPTRPPILEGKACGSRHFGKQMMFSLNLHSAVQQGTSARTEAAKKAPPSARHNENVVGKDRGHGGSAVRWMVRGTWVAPFETAKARWHCGR